MKKLILGLIAFTGSVASLPAQSYLTNNPENSAHFGVRLGIDVSSTAGESVDSYSNGAGFSIGGIYNIPLYMNLYFEPGISLFYDTFGTEIPIGDNIATLESIDGSIRNLGFRVPFHFGYHFDFTDEISVHIYTGPALNWNLWAHQYFPNYKAYGFEGSNESILGDRGFKHFDMQWDFGVGVQYNNYYVSIGGGIGRTKAYKNIATDDFFHDSFRRNTFNISLGYNF